MSVDPLTLRGFNAEAKRAAANAWAELNDIHGIAQRIQIPALGDDTTTALGDAERVLAAAARLVRHLSALAAIEAVRFAVSDEEE